MIPRAVVVWKCGVVVSHLPTACSLTSSIKDSWEQVNIHNNTNANLLLPLLDYTSTWLYYGSTCISIFYSTVTMVLVEWTSPFNGSTWLYLTLVRVSYSTRFTHWLSFAFQICELNIFRSAQLKPVLLYTMYVPVKAAISSEMHCHVGSCPMIS